MIECILFAKRQQRDIVNFNYEQQRIGSVMDKSFQNSGI